MTQINHDKFPQMKLSATLSSRTPRLPGRMFVLLVGVAIAACRLHAQNNVTFTTLYYFGDTDGCETERIIRAADGSFYGATFGGRPDTIFKMTTNGVLTRLHSFNGSDGSGPSGMVLGSDGNLYGTTEWGGPGFNGNVGSGDGTVFRMTPAGTLTTLHSFSGPDGRWPRSGLIQGTDGNFYGTTAGGGVANSYGTNLRRMFKM